MTYNHIMVDFESLGLAIHGKMAFVGFLSFDPFVQNTHEELMNQVIEVKLDWTHEEQADYTHDSDVLAFWAKQPLDIRKKMLDCPELGVSVTDFCNQFEDYLHRVKFNGNIDAIWARGTSFDITILERLYHGIGRDVPFPFYRARDVRTFVDALNIAVDATNKHGSNFIGKIPHVNQTVSNHDARFDISNDIVNVQQTIQHLKQLGSQTCLTHSH